MSRSDSKTISPSGPKERKAGDKPPSILRTIVQRQEDDFRESKPFQKKYGHPNTTGNITNKEEKVLSRQSMEDTFTSKKLSQLQGPGAEQNYSTKQSFNQRLHNNIIKDEERAPPIPPSSRNSFRIKKVETKSPKKVRDDLAVLNEVEYKLQKQIMDFHKTHKSLIQTTIQSFNISQIGLEAWLQKNKESEQSPVPTGDSLVHHLSNCLKLKGKALSKLQKKIAQNPYYLYSEQHADLISQQTESQEEGDIVEELPNKHQLNANSGSYSMAMQGIKNKQHGLNLRRTYEVFKDPPAREGKSEAGHFQESPKDEVTLDRGQNRMTLNNKFKDFLLS